MALPWLIGGAVLLGVAAIAGSEGGGDDEEERRREERRERRRLEREAEEQRARLEKAELRLSLENELEQEAEGFLSRVNQSLNPYITISNGMFLLDNLDLDVGFLLSHNLDLVFDDLSSKNLQDIKKQLILIESMYGAELTPTSEFLDEVTEIKNISQKEAALLNIKNKLIDLKKDIETNGVS